MEHVSTGGQRCSSSLIKLLSKDPEQRAVRFMMSKCFVYCASVCVCVSNPPVLCSNTLAGVWFNILT